MSDQVRDQVNLKPGDVLPHIVGLTAILGK